jgi:hypothetical protein
MILISAGHHPDKKGACFGDFCEHDEAKIWVSFIAHHLGHTGMVVPTGTLKNKVQFINDMAVQNDIAVEIHFNAAVNSKGENVGRGSETLYYPTSTRGRQIAEKIQSRLGAIYTPDRGAKEGWYRMNRAFGPDYFLQRTKCAAVIVEPDFIHRKEIIQSHRDEACKTLAEVLHEINED